jgi:hypothetical protein
MRGRRRQVGERWMGAIAIGCLSLALAACGGNSAVSGGGSARSIREMVTCLRHAGATAEPLEVDSAHEMAGAYAANGDVIFILNLPNSDLSARATQAVREGMHEAGHGGIMTTSTVDRGSTLIGVIGVEGVDGGVPSAGSEELARECATRTRARAAPAPQRGAQGDVL